MDELNKNQKKVVKRYLSDIIDSLEGIAGVFLNHLQEKGVLSLEEKQCICTNNHSTDRERLTLLLPLLPARKDGWEVMISYFEKNNFNVAKTLKDSIKELRNSSNPVAEAATATTRPTVSKTFTKNDFKEFKKTLAGYYRSQYSKVRTMFGCSRDVNEIWVPLRLEEKTKNLRQKDNFSHLQLLERLAGKETYSVALVKGHPGVGKTTLVQKIAYDWATKKAEQFDVILTVPLRYVEETSDFLDLAADYYTTRLQVFPGYKEELIQWLNDLGNKLLICFDGLDEYDSLADSPFKTMFTDLFQRTTNNTNNKACPIRFLPYKLLITSRPYACESMIGDFLPLRFEICPVDKAHLADFIELYSVTDEGKRRVTSYLRDQSDLVIKVPLILTFVCYLADMNEEIPTNLTLLYDKLLSHMVKREIEWNKLAEKVKTDKWKELAVTKATAHLAFEGCKTGKLEFSPSLKLDVTKDSFTCGFLLHKFNFREEKLNAEFPHRSVQEFFAALHCYQLTSTTETRERNFVMREVLLNKDSQFGRFFFGLCSAESKKFKEMLDWLNPTFDDAKIIEKIYDYNKFLSRLSECLSDGYEAQLFGQRLAASLDQLEDRIQKEGRKNIEEDWIRPFGLPLLNRTFQSGLNLNGTSLNWSISHVNKPRWTRLSFVYENLSVDLREKFDKIEISVLHCSIHKLAEQITSVDLLPEVSTLIIRTAYDLEVNFHLEYETTTTTAPTSATTQLRHFCFQFRHTHIKVLKENFKDQLDKEGLIIVESHKTGQAERGPGETRWMTVRVKNSFDRSDLLRMLIPLALEIFFCPSDETSFNSYSFFCNTDENSKDSGEKGIEDLVKDLSSFPTTLLPYSDDDCDEDSGNSNSPRSDLGVLKNSTDDIWPHDLDRGSKGNSTHEDSMD